MSRAYSGQQAYGGSLLTASCMMDRMYAANAATASDPIEVVCRHTWCSNMAKAGMNPKTLQYLMGHSDISVTMNTYTHLGLEDAQAELHRLEETEAARKEQEKISGKSMDKPDIRKFRAG